VTVGAEQYEILLVVDFWVALRARAIFLVVNLSGPGEAVRARSAVSLDDALGDVGVEGGTITA
jgi:hypothetical protein